MRTPYTVLTIKYPEGCKQVVRPDFRYFEGDWFRLVEGICGGDFQRKGITWNVK